MSDVVKFYLGQIVYRKIKPDEPGIVTAIVMRENSTSYYVTWPDHSERTNFGLELTTEKSFVQKQED